MNKIIATILILSLCSQYSIKTGIVGFFLLNQDYIAKVLCINKDKPELDCKGKCHLKKQLKQEEEQTPKLPTSTVKEIIENLIYIEEYKLSPKAMSSNNFNKTITNYHFSCITATLESIFHPPRG